MITHPLDSLTANEINKAVDLYRSHDESDENTLFTNVTLVEPSKDTVRSFKEGEDLYSSGLGKVFPPNYLVGKVVLIEDKPDNKLLNIDVEFIDLPEEQDYFLVFTK